MNTAQKEQELKEERKPKHRGTGMKKKETSTIIPLVTVKFKGKQRIELRTPVKT